MKASSSLRVALDTNLIVRMWSRRYLTTAIAVSANRIVLPQTALELAVQRYDLVSSGANEDAAVVRWSAINDPEIRQDLNQFPLFLADIAWARRKAFEKWLYEEARATPSAWDIAPRTDRSEATAVFLRTSGALGDPDDRRYGGTGEDAQVLGEAIESGCIWIGTSNYRSLSRTKLDGWLYRQDPGLELHVPFVVHPDEAVQLLLPEADARTITQIAYAVVHESVPTPDRHEREAHNLRRLQKGLAAGDLAHTAIQIAAYVAAQGGFGSALTANLEREAAPLLARTGVQREIDARRRVAEHEAIQRVPYNLLSPSEFKYQRP